MLEKVGIYSVNFYVFFFVFHIFIITRFSVDSNEKPMKKGQNDVPPSFDFDYCSEASSAGAVSVAVSSVSLSSGFVEP